MSSREYAVDELRAVLSGMGVKDVVSAARYGSGHINDTFKVDCASGTSYILQRINTDIFDPDAVMSNIRRVTEHIRAKGGKSLEVVAYTRPWRLYAFIQGAHTVDLITEAGQAYKAASAASRRHHPQLPQHRLAPRAARRCPRGGREGPRRVVRTRARLRRRPPRRGRHDRGPHGARRQDRKSVV